MAVSPVGARGWSQARVERRCEGGAELLTEYPARATRPRRRRALAVAPPAWPRLERRLERPRLKELAVGPRPSLEGRPALRAP
eukprot:CAMPEP_0172623464 /NCGR_PEP_ID=MMETSP1068-20121228/128953_1 /TAXON_ID=35684 /ORGANISM="Pseudopedinella elastica, Strain CCMP716" /LENGTH=82 /DNA_ID=CAMNT_0013432035 /DNA_START=180 /DNA_END=424 /DNA_ORIENTATION=+